MALNQSALDEIGAMLKNGDSFDLVRRAVEFVPLELIEAEAAAPHPVRSTTGRIDLGQLGSEVVITCTEPFSPPLGGVTLS